MQNSPIVLIPPILVILLAAKTRKIFFSIIVGILSSLFISYNYDPVVTIQQFFIKIIETTEILNIFSFKNFFDSSYLLISIFLLILGIIITMVQRSGGVYAYANFIMKYLKKSVHAELSLLFLSTVLFFDDYFNCLTVGSVMQKITDRFRIPRVKLSFLVNSIAAPLVVMLPMSSWVAQIVMQLRNSGVTDIRVKELVILADPFWVYLNVLPFIFYSMIIIFSVWYIVIRKRSFGIIRKHEIIAARTGSLFAGKSPLYEKNKSISDDVIGNSCVFDFIFPIAVLFISTLFSILYFGKFKLFGGSATFIQALQDTKIEPALFLGSFITLLITSIFFILRRKISFRSIPNVLSSGVSLMGSSVAILILIWTFSGIIKNDLGTGNYVASFLTQHLEMSFVPPIIFVLSAIIATLVGSAWGTLGIMIPIAVPMIASLSNMSIPIQVIDLPILMPMVGAIISGSVIANHLSPISDTMYMSSFSCGSYHIDLVRSQFEITLPTVFSTTISFVISGLLVTKLSLMMAAGISFLAGFIVNIIIIETLHYISHRK